MDVRKRKRKTLSLFCHKLEPSIIFSFNVRINYKMTTKYAFINFLFSGALILAVFKTILLTFSFKLTFIICKTYLFCPIHKNCKQGNFIQMAVTQSIFDGFKKTKNHWNQEIMPVYIYTCAKGGLIF